MPAPLPRDPRDDATAVVNTDNESNIWYWADQLAVTVPTLRLLVSIHGPAVRDLLAAIENAGVQPEGGVARP